MTTANILLQSVAAVPWWASRPFVSTFVLALAARYTNLIAAPPWFIATATLIIMGMLAVTEVFAHKDPDIREWLDEFEGVLKAIITLIVTFSLMDAESVALLDAFRPFISETSSMSSVIGAILSAVWSAVTAAGTWLVDGVRRNFLAFFKELDEDDDIGLQGMMSWMEDFAAPVGIVVAIWLPILALTFFGLTLLVLYIVQKQVERRSERNKVNCANCKELNFPTAPSCYNCGHKNEQIVQVGFFGQPTERPVTDKTAHRIQLIAHKRCPTCATKLKQKTVRQTCIACGTETFADETAVNDYLAVLQPKLWQTTAICFLLGLIPLLGLVPGIIYYRLSLISSLRRYIPKQTGCLTRWGVRLLNLILIALQPIPVFGAFTLPLMCYTNYMIYQKVLQHEGRRKFSHAVARPGPAPG